MKTRTKLLVAGRNTETQPCIYCGQGVTEEMGGLWSLPGVSSKAAPGMVHRSCAVLALAEIRTPEFLANRTTASREEGISNRMNSSEGAQEGMDGRTILSGSELADRMRLFAEGLDQDSARAFLQKAGILDANGNLAEPYRT